MVVGANTLQVPLKVRDSGMCRQFASVDLTLT